ncbi:unnamed protein product [Symbiodinium microadriaticum]|nr:unnamed protein product [Symbiodinium microadriaticum]
MAGRGNTGKLTDRAMMVKGFLERVSLGAAASLKKLAEKAPDSATTMEATRRLRLAAKELLERLQQAEAFNLKTGDTTSLSVSMRGKSILILKVVLRNSKSRVANLVDDLLQLPPATALAVLVVSLRGTVVLARLSNAAAREVLQMLIHRWRSTLLITATPCFLILRRHRQQLLKDLPASPLQLGLSQACLQLASNLRPFPPLFWVSAASTALLTLQALETVGLWALTNGARVRRSLVATSLVVLLVAKSGQAREALRERMGQLASAEALSETWSKTRSVMVDLGHALRVAVAPKAVPRRVPPGGELTASPSPKHKEEEPAKVDFTMVKGLLPKADMEIRPPVFGGSQ